MCAYATTKQFAERSGLGQRVVDEVVGTGDNTETSFDLDNDNVIAGTYTLNYAASGSNSFTALTETTHYTLDKESGKIVLTTAGKTALGTNILYATYIYTIPFPDSIISDFIDIADAQIDKLTGQRWTTPTSKVEYRSGRKSLTYPTTDNPYMADWDAPDFIVLNDFPVTKITNAYFLNDPLMVEKVYNYDDSASTYTEYTKEANSSSESPFTLFAATPAADDLVYIGSSQMFLGLNVVLSTDGTGSPSISWEYYNGTAWTTMTTSETDSGSSSFTASGKFTWTHPYAWAKTSVNGVTAYWVRAKVATGYTVAPICATFTIRDSIASTLEPRNLNYSSNGILTFHGIDVPNGTNNIRIDYYYGYDTTPDYITELSTLIASLQAFIFLTGGSYDNATSYVLGSKTVTIGQQYVNIREVLDQFNKRIDSILSMIGKRAHVSAI